MFLSQGSATARNKLPICTRSFVRKLIKLTDGLLFLGTGLDIQAEAKNILFCRVSWKEVNQWATNYPFCKLQLVVETFGHST